MDSVELCSFLRQSPDYAEWPIITDTGMMDTKTVDQAYATDAMDYAKTLFDVSNLMRRLGLPVRSLKRSHAR